MDIAEVRLSDGGRDKARGWPKSTAQNVFSSVGFEHMMKVIAPAPGIVNCELIYTCLGCRDEGQWEKKKRAQRTRLNTFVLWVPLIISYPESCLCSVVA